MKKGVFLKVSSIVLLLVVFLATVSFGACSKKNAAKLASTETGLTIIKYPNLLFSDPIYIADELGFLKEEGLQVQFTGVLPPADQIASVVSGGNDFAGTSAAFLTLAIANGFEVRCVAAGWASTKENPASAWIIRADSPYQSIKDLVGKKVGGTPRAYSWLEALDKAGLQEADVDIVELDFDKVEIAVEKGDVAAGEVLNPYLSRAVQSGQFKILLDENDIYGEQAGWPQQFTSIKLIKENPELVRHFVSAIAKANDWAREHPNEAGKIFAKVFDTPDEYASYYTAAYPAHALINEANAQLYLDQAIKYGDIKKGDITLADIYTNEFNPYNK